jgi:LemA protein
MPSWRASGLAVSMLAVVALGWGSVRLQRDVDALGASVDARWSEVEEQLARQHDLVPSLVSVTRSHAPVDEGLYTALAEARTRYLAAPPAQRPAEARAVDAAFAELLRQARRRPDIAADPGFREVCRRIAATHDPIARARARYDDEAALLNARIAQLPWRLFAGGSQQRSLYEPPAVPLSDPGLAAAP